MVYGFLPYPLPPLPPAGGRGGRGEVVI